MDKIDVINKYRLSIDKLRIESIWDDIYSVNRVVRYERSVGEIVDIGGANGVFTDMNVLTSQITPDISTIELQSVSSVPDVSP